MNQMQQFKKEIPPCLYVIVKAHQRTLHRIAAINRDIAVYLEMVVSKLPQATVFSKYKPRISKAFGVCSSERYIIAAMLPTWRTPVLWRCFFHFFNYNRSTTRLEGWMLLLQCVDTIS